MDGGPTVRGHRNSRYVGDLHPALIARKRARLSDPFRAAAGARGPPGAAAPRHCRGAWASVISGAQIAVTIRRNLRFSMSSAQVPDDGRPPLSTFGAGRFWLAMALAIPPFRSATEKPRPDRRRGGRRGRPPQRHRLWRHRGSRPHRERAAKGTNASPKPSPLIPTWAWPAMGERGRRPGRRSPPRRDLSPDARSPSSPRRRP